MALFVLEGPGSPPRDVPLHIVASLGLSAFVCQRLSSLLGLAGHGLRTCRAYHTYLLFVWCSNGAFFAFF